MDGLQFQAVDTLFFRDGTPFSSGSASQDDVGGQFPPHPPTVVGALRASLARCNGWNGRRHWQRELNAVLGDGPDLGRLSFQGPFLLRKGQPLFATPRHLLGCILQGHWHPRAFVEPGPAVTCDLGDDVRLPRIVTIPSDIPERELHATKGNWLTGAGMEAVLRGRLPGDDDVVAWQELWMNESRIGLKRDNVRRTAVPGLLYSTRHVRLRQHISIGMQIAGIPDSWRQPVGHVVPLGGERRMAECNRWDTNATINSPIDEITRSGHLTVIALTPLDLDVSICRGEVPLAEFGGARVVSACIARQERIGGWNSLVRRPLAMRSVLPAGSVLFCQLDKPAEQLAIRKSSPGLRSIGNRQRWGFGVVALGTW